MSYDNDNDIKEVTWYSYKALVQELTEKYTQFASFSFIYQKALPILINYLKNEEQ